MQCENMTLEINSSATQEEAIMQTLWIIYAWQSLVAETEAQEERESTSELDPQCPSNPLISMQTDTAWNNEECTVSTKPRVREPLKITAQFITVW